jgi:hypothetical protein
MNEIQLAYVRGYRLALEDVIRDLEELQDPPLPCDGADYYYGMGKQYILREAYDRVAKTLESANLTIKILERMEGESDHEPREHGEVDQGPGDAPGSTGTSSPEED